MKLHLLVWGTTLLLGTSQATLAALPNWVLIGDSWGEALGEVHRTALAEHGYPLEVTNLSVGGTTAEQWATDFWGMLSTAKAFLSDLPADQRTVVYVSLGGNDLLGEWPSMGEEVYERVATDVTFIIEELFVAKPNILILLGGYDLLNMDQSFFCRLFSNAIFGSVEPEVVNQIVFDGGAIMDELGTIHPRVISLNIVGALQGRTGDPDLSSWSPREYMSANTLDCIHLSDSGYAKFTNASLNLLARRLGLD